MFHSFLMEGEREVSHHHKICHRSFRIIVFISILLLVLLLAFSLQSCHSRSERSRKASDASSGRQEEAKENSSKGKASKESSPEEEKKEEGPEKDQSKNNDKVYDGIPVEVSEILVRDISSFLTSTTNIEAENEATILAEIDGRVVQIHKEEGDKVRKGQLLAKLDDEEKLIALRKAKIKAENEKGNYERSRKLYEEHLLSSEAFDEVSYRYALAKSELEEAEYNLSKTRVVAPFSGEVTVRHIKIGQNVKPADPLFTVTNRDLLVAHIYLPEEDALGLAIGQEVKISVPWDETARYSGRIERISPIVDAQTGTVKITIYARDLPKMIKPGSFVSIYIVKEVHNNAVLIPKRSIIKDFQESFVFIVEGEIARKIKVKLGFEDNGYVEVLSGLHPGQKVVSTGQGGLKDGSKVKIISG